MKHTIDGPAACRLAQEEAPTAEAFDTAQAPTPASRRQTAAAGVGDSHACTAASTHRLRLEDTQDAVTALRLPNGMRAVAVADGLGGFACGGEAARFVIGTIPPVLHTARSPVALFALLQQRLAAHVRGGAAPQSGPVGASRGGEVAAGADDLGKGDTDTARSWGTTLLLGWETPDLLMAAYVGNGGLFHLRGDFAECGPARFLPWNMVNLLSPHSISERGREALTRYLAPVAAPGQTDPTVIGLRKDAQVGDLLLLCSDGIFSQDQVRCGDPGDGSVWGEVSLPLLAVQQALRARWQQPGELTEEELRQTLQFCLDELRARRALDDDASLALLVTAQALAYRRQQLEEKKRRSG